MIAWRPSRSARADDSRSNRRPALRLAGSALAGIAMVGQDRPDLAIERDGRRGIARRRLARDRQQYERGPDHGLFPAMSFTMGPASQYKADAGRGTPWRSRVVRSQDRLVFPDHSRRE